MDRLTLQPANRIQSLVEFCLYREWRFGVTCVGATSSLDVVLYVGSIQVCVIKTSGKPALGQTYSLTLRCTLDPGGTSD